MTHEHDLPSTFADVQECATELYAIITGQVEASYVEIAAHAYQLLGYLLFVLGADEDNVIGTTADKEATLQLTANELRAIDDCMCACGNKSPVVGGPLAAWSLRVIVMTAIKQLLAFLAELMETKDTEKAIAGLGDGTLLRVLLENLPAIMAAIAQFLELFSKDE